MKYKSPLIAVTDIDRSAAFYEDVLGLRVMLDFGANKTLTDGIVLQTEESWKTLINAQTVAFGENCFELYFEESDFDGFVQRLLERKISYLHPVKEHPWGQRVVRFYDPDRHIIEVGEELAAVCRRFAAQGMTHAQIAQRMDVPESFVCKCLGEDVCI